MPAFAVCIYCGTECFDQAVATAGKGQIHDDVRRRG
jgi:hypothetical protein